MDIEARDGLRTEFSEESLLDETMGDVSSEIRDASSQESQLDPRTIGGFSLLAGSCANPETFVFLASSGQLVHQQSNKCITVDTKASQGDASVSLKDCVDWENQHHMQRFDVPFYTPGPEGFQSGTGIIKVGYGSHTNAAWCLAVTASSVEVRGCTSNSITQFTWEAGDSQQHKWLHCAHENSIVNPSTTLAARHPGSMEGSSSSWALKHYEVPPSGLISQILLATLQDYNNNFQRLPNFTILRSTNWRGPFSAAPAPNFAKCTFSLQHVFSYSRSIQHRKII